MQDYDFGHLGLGLSVLLALFALASCSQSGADQAGCIPTEADSLGPYYVAGTAITDNLNRFEKPGDPLVVEGKVLSATGDNAPIAGAAIEIWQTDGAGNYYPEDKGHVDDYEDQAIDLRGTVETDEEGGYRFSTVVPGAYFPRPRHWHYRISANGFETLVTQLYVTGDGTIQQPGGDCRHASIEPAANGLSYAAPPVFLEPR